jgi:hypothetical protein
VAGHRRGKLSQTTSRAEAPRRTVQGGGYAAGDLSQLAVNEEDP